MKFNWGTGAFLLFTGFVVFILIMVFLASGQSHELVTEHYYEKELTFKDVLKQKARTQELEAPIDVHISNGQLKLVLPTAMQSTTGTIEFFKPSSEKDDRLLTFSGDHNTYAFDLSDFHKGMYKMKLTWQVNNLTYYHEQKIDL